MERLNRKVARLEEETKSMKKLAAKGTGFGYIDDPDYIEKICATPDSELSEYLKRVKASYLPLGKSP